MTDARIPRTPVNSTCIASIGYSATDCVLDVEFASGSVYRYFDVPPDVHADLVRAESIGAHFNRGIRSRFNYVKA